MNLEKDVAKLIMDAYGLQDGERFHIQYKNNVVKECHYMFEDKTLKYQGVFSNTPYDASSKTFEDIIYDRAKIIKIPWKPKNGENYWTYYGTYYEADDIDWNTSPSTWYTTPTDLCRYKCGIVFRTEEEALKNLESKKKELLEG